MSGWNFIENSIFYWAIHENWIWFLCKIPIKKCPFQWFFDFFIKYSRNSWKIKRARISLSDELWWWKCSEKIVMRSSVQFDRAVSKTNINFSIYYHKLERIVSFEEDTHTHMWRGVRVYLFELVIWWTLRLCAYFMYVLWQLIVMCVARLHHIFYEIIDKCLQLNNSYNNKLYTEIIYIICLFSGCWLYGEFLYIFILCED